MTSTTVSLAQDLIRRPSVTPKDDGCQDLIAARLAPLGFRLTPLRYGDVDNLWARRGESAPLFVFAGHTDVVPIGDENAWALPPFDGTIASDMLHGRGAADMKGSLAAMVTATERFTADRPEHLGSIAFLLTSDEEGPAVDGTVRVIDHLTNQGVSIDYCIVGEPTSSEQLGDTIKNGRRGSLSAHLRVRGTQGHVAYPQLADNPIHRLAQILQLLATESWDQGNAHFPPTTFQVSNCQSGTGAGNVIPQTADAWFNFRFSTESTAASLRARTEAIVARCAADVTFDWTLSGQPFITNPGTLTQTVCDAIEKVTGTRAELSTTGGTSDARFIAPTGAQVIELGPLNKTIHRVDEHVSTDDLDRLSAIYEAILTKLLGP